MLETKGFTCLQHFFIATFEKVLPYHAPDLEVQDESRPAHGIGRTTVNLLFKRFSCSAGHLIVNARIKNLDKSWENHAVFSMKDMNRIK